MENSELLLKVQLLRFEIVRSRVQWTSGGFKYNCCAYINAVILESTVAVIIKFTAAVLIENTAAMLIENTTAVLI